MVDVSAVVMAHHSRAQWARECAERIDAPAEIIWDRHEDVWDTGRRALTAHSTSATHHMILQDDTLPCFDLVAAVKKMVNWIPPGRPICLYFGSRSRGSHYARLAFQAQRQGLHWVVMPSSPMWGIGLVLPTDHIPNLIDYGDRTNVGKGSIYDGRVRRWYRQRRIEQWYPVPSPVEHRGPREGVRSLLNHGQGPGRTAFVFLGDDASALDVDWRTEAVGKT